MGLYADYGLPGLPLFPDQASGHAGRVDTLFFFILAVTGGLGLLITVLLLVFAARYRRRTAADRTPRITGFPLLEWGWTLAPLLPFAVMYGWGLVVYGENFRPPPDSYEVFVVGKQWMWKAQHPGGQREINELHLPAGRHVKVTLISEDVVHDFGVPAFRQKIDVLPGRYVSTWFDPTTPGRYHLFCDQYCGTGHADMVGGHRGDATGRSRDLAAGGCRGVGGPGGQEAVPKVPVRELPPRRRGGPGTGAGGVVRPSGGDQGRRGGGRRPRLHPRLDPVPVEARGRRLGADHAHVPGAGDRGTRSFC